jgi:small GTP-binding protein
MLGEFAVGKTSLVKRFIFDRFDDKYISTIGVKVSRKSLVIPRGDEVVDLNMMLWDLAGSEEFSSVRTSYLRGASGAILVCDLTRPDTLSALSQYVDDLRTVNRHVQLVIAANKADLEAERELDDEQIAVIAASLGAPFFLTSAKTGFAVNDMFRTLGLRLLEM